MFLSCVMQWMVTLNNDRFIKFFFLFFSAFTKNKNKFVFSFSRYWCMEFFKEDLSNFNSIPIRVKSNLKPTELVHTKRIGTQKKICYCYVLPLVVLKTMTSRCHLPRRMNFAADCCIPIKIETSISSFDSFLSELYHRYSKYARIY